ncbi:hypothetical protein VQH23_07345 [Pararoseomonas sp. SCSIO 73927]|uniref:hypothetical protein n=1 Tax=Pararoseomonas sp. SCSIO 73927 TaxID=3114537 RepID=UPI0030CF3BFE
MNTFQEITFPIPAGQSVSEAARLGGGAILGLVLPSDWEGGAVVAVQGALAEAPAAGDWFDVADGSGVTATLGPTTGKLLQFDVPPKGCRWVRLVSRSSAGAPAAQAAAKTIRASVWFFT